MIKPKFSIIIPTKNRGYCVWKSIQSIQNQTFRDWELLVVDGNSKDNTEKVVNEFADDKRIKFILNLNDTGVASARNYGITQSLGEYIAYLDSDDIVMPYWLEEVNKSLTKDSNQFVLPNKRFVMKLVDNQNRTLQTFIDRSLYDSPPTINSIANLEVPSDTNGMVHSREIIDTTGFWNTELKLYEDYDFLVRLFDFFPNGLVYIPKELVVYTRTYGKDGLCGKAKYSDLIECLEKVYELHCEKKTLKEITWYPKTVEKYRVYMQEEDNGGRTILDHLIEKYSDGKNK